MSRVWVVSRLVLVAAACGLLAGCFTGMEPRQEYVLVFNRSDVTIGVSYGTEPDTSRWISPGPGEEDSVPININGLDCGPDLVLSAWTEDDLLVATYGPPVCTGYEWTITQADVDAARANASVPSPTPAG